MDYDPREREQRKILRKMGNPTWSFVWKFLACCFVLDAGVWGYFAFVEKVPVLVGLQRIQDGIREKREIKKLEEMAKSQLARLEIKQKEKKVPSPEEEIKRQAGITPQNYSEKEKIDKHAQEVNKMVAESIAKKDNDKYRGTIYSWISREGKRTYSNIGFPKDGQYTDPKIEINE